eukprot:350180-Chlamydomonas_euryale.AAC.4
MPLLSQGSCCGWWTPVHGHGTSTWHTYGHGHGASAHLGGAHCAVGHACPFWGQTGALNAAAHVLTLAHSRARTHGSMQARGLALMNGCACLRARLARRTACMRRDRARARGL